MLKALFLYLYYFKNVCFEFNDLMPYPFINFFHSLLQRYQFIAHKYAAGLFYIAKAAGIIGDDAHHLRRYAVRRHHVITAYVLDIQKFILCRHL